jgi:tRNA (adenine22-N1)-methyltransferase
VAADIGTDHAQLPRALLTRGAPRVIAIDASAAALKSAGPPEPGLELRPGDGLSALYPGEASVGILAGLGGLTIGELLARDPPRPLGLTRLILQPHSHPEAARSAAAEAGYHIVDEVFVREGARFFVVIVADASEDPVHLDEADRWLGPVLRRRGGPWFEAWRGLQLERQRALPEPEGWAALLHTRAPDVG